MSKNSLRYSLAVLLLVPLYSCSKATNNPALVGLWEGKINNKYVSLTFEKDGELIWGGDITSLGNIFTKFGLLTDFGSRPGKNTPITYRCLNDSKMEVEGDFTAMLAQLSAGGRGDEKLSPDWKETLRPKETLTFTVVDKELTLINQKGNTTKLRLANSKPQ